jgi:hypothetical protein
VSVRKDSRSPYWQYNFQIKGQRYYGSTKCENKRDAEAIEHAMRVLTKHHGHMMVLSPDEADRIGTERRREQHSEARRKFLSFIADGIEPACYLYRHFGPDGDLLYVGISLHPLERHKQHVKGAAWMKNIYQIIIEPFATREEALAAEELAIRTEYPKFNSTHNQRRNPFQELARPRKYAVPAQCISTYLPFSQRVGKTKTAE